MFGTSVRYSGMAIGTQIGFALGGFSPAIAAAIVGDGPNAWLPVALLTARPPRPWPGSARSPPARRRTSRSRELGQPGAAPVQRDRVAA